MVPGRAPKRSSHANPGASDGPREGLISRPNASFLPIVDQGMGISYDTVRAMSITTSQQISKYYDSTDIDITFTKEVIKASGLVTQQSSSSAWAAVALRLYSTSFNGPRYRRLSRRSRQDPQGEQPRPIRYPSGSSARRPLTFFIAGKVQGFSPTTRARAPPVHHRHLHQRPPDPSSRSSAASSRPTSTRPSGGTSASF
jgi:hypothetical protein